MSKQRKRYLWVCTKERPPTARKGSCALHGAEELLRALKIAAGKAKADVRVCQSGCFDLCWVGPTAAVMPDNVFLKHLTPDDIPALVDVLTHSRPIDSAPSLAAKLVQPEDFVDPNQQGD